jgi:hypothetical protein
MSRLPEKAIRVLQWALLSEPLLHYVLSVPVSC